MKAKKVLYYPLIFLIFLGVLYVFENASIANLVYPFAFSFMFALVWANQKPWIVCPAYLAASIIYDYSFANIISSICCVFALVVPYYIHILLKKNIKIWELAIYAGISQIANILFAYFYGQAYYYNIISMVVGIMFMYISIFILDSFFTKGITKRLNIIELISGGVILAILSDGLTPLTIGPFSFLKFFVAFTILVIAYSGKTYYAVFVAAILGFGSLIGINNPVFVAPFIIWAMFISPFKSYKKYLMPISLIAAECLVGFYFNLYYNFSPWEITPVIVGALAFAAIPDSVYDRLRAILSTKSNRAAIKDVMNRNRELLQNRLSCLGEVFADMDISFKKLAQKSFSKSDMKDVLKRELKSRVCQNCPERERCYRNYNNELEEIFDEIADISFERGKISILDIPNFLSSHCTKIPMITSTTNTLCAQYKRYTDLVGNVDTSKLLIADQLEGVSKLMKNLSKEVESPMSFDSAREQKIMDELLFNNIICDDIIVFERDIHNLEVVLLVRNEDKEKTAIPKIVGKICGAEMVVSESFSIVKPGWTTLSLKTAPKFDCTFGLSAKTKADSFKSGDTHSILKLDSEKFMFALCDGMGSGEKAEEASETAIGLVENFYKAGFENEIVMSSVNKLLNLQKEEVFSAIDICVLDLKNGIADFIKMGTPNCFVLSKERCHIIEGGALPLGIVEEGNAKSQKAILERGDFIVLVTDGISDSFATDDQFTEFLCSLSDKNPQSMSDKILEKALANNHGLAKDDMTCLVVKIF